LRAYDAFLAPPYYLCEKGNSLTECKKTFRETFVKISLQWKDTQQEIAYGEFSADDLSQLFEGGQKMAWPLLGIGSVHESVDKIKRRNEEINYPPVMEVTDDSDVACAIGLLHQSCRELNSLIQGSSMSIEI
jgi:hypothetical protein